MNTLDAEVVVMRLEEEGVKATAMQVYDDWVVKVYNAKGDRMFTIYEVMPSMNKYLWATIWFVVGCVVGVGGLIIGYGVWYSAHVS
jgi:hypothetical protein